MPPQKAIDSYNEYYKLLESDTYYIGNILINNIKKFDIIKTKDGRIGIVMAIYFDTNNLEIEFGNNTSNTETIDIKDVEEILKDAE